MDNMNSQVMIASPSPDDAEFVKATLIKALRKKGFRNTITGIVDQYYAWEDELNEYTRFRNRRLVLAFSREELENIVSRMISEYVGARAVIVYHALPPGDATTEADVDSGEETTNDDSEFGYRAEAPDTEYWDDEGNGEYVHWIRECMTVDADWAECYATLECIDVICYYDTGACYEWGRDIEIVPIEDCGGSNIA